ncbi:MAG TPA: hypothetical protein VMU07_00905 [Candidatus Paceibacterota bacterium]|nr:hypothetical protein [Candidatus Paceibacterota bacterium]
MKKFVVAAALSLSALIAWFVLPVLSRADVASSTDFTVQDSYAGFFSGVSSSTDFTVVQGSTPFISNNNTSTDFGTHSGPVNFSSFTPQSRTWRWYNDAGDEKPTSSMAAENVAPSGVSSSIPIKLRLNIVETGGTGADNVKFGLQYSTFSDFSASVGTVTEIANCISSSTWCYASVAGGGNDNAVVSSTVLSTSGACAAGVGVGCGTHNTSAVSTSTFTQNASATTEYEFTIEGISTAAGQTYFFRPVYEDNGTPVPLYSTSSYPSLVTAGAGLTFTVSGLPQGTATSGIVTNVSTTATSISFGTLTIATSVTGAQQLTVTTNAANGYELYALQDSPLSDGSGHVIPGVSGTNASPVSWSGGCSATSSGCFGYHTGSAVLSGGSTRFAANDTYAALTSSTGEIGYAGSPSTSSTVSVVYRIQAGSTQVNGNYVNNIVYVVAPSF